MTNSNISACVTIYHTIKSEVYNLKSLMQFIKNKKSLLFSSIFFSRFILFGLLRAFIKI